MSTVETARLGLRTWETDDRDELAQLYAGPAITRYVGGGWHLRWWGWGLAPEGGLGRLYGFRDTGVVWYPLERTIWERSRAAEPSIPG